MLCSTSEIAEHKAARTWRARDLATKTLPQHRALGCIVAYAPMCRAFRILSKRPRRGPLHCPCVGLGMLPRCWPTSGTCPASNLARVADDPLRDLTQHSLNAHEVLPRRDVHLAAAEAATFGVQMPCHNQCDRESAERCGAIGRWWSAGSLPPGCSRRRTSAKSMAIEIRGRWPRSWASISSSANRRRS